MNLGLFLYRSALRIFSLALKGAAAFNPKARLFVEGRKQIFEEIRAALPANGNNPRVWFHCASLGEFEQGRPVIEKFKEIFPEYEVVLTFYSPSGYEVRKHYKLASYVFYLPIDGPENSRKFLDLIKPDASFFIKYEFWYYYLKELDTRKIPTFSVSAIFRSDQLFFKSYGGFYEEMLHFFTHIFVQDRNSKSLLNEIGIENVSVSGDTRFDRVVDLRSHSKKLPLVDEFKNNQPLLVIGSSWKEDMDVLLPFISKNKYSLKYIIAPHEIHEDNIKAIQLSVKLPSIRYSEALEIKDRSLSKYSVLIIDNIGLLSSLYSYGEYAYIGGAFGKGLHNTLEAATFGVPIIFGNKNYAKFKEATELISEGGAFAIANEKELDDAFQFLSAPGELQKAGEISAAYILKNVGATDQIITYCKQLLDSKGIKH